MYSTDPIADMLSRIRNAIMIGKSSVDVPHSKIKEQIAKILESNNYLETVTIDGEGKSKLIHITINKELSPASITEITRVSKPGRRVYTNSSEIPKVKSGRGMVVMSTSKGLMTGTEAETANIGGEVICSVY
ncbi:MAG: 30S ribosomal protein S8 [Patescibacteria group bacterium]